MCPHLLVVDVAEHEGDRDFGLKADAVVASMAAKAVGVSQKIAESLASNDLKADKVCATMSVYFLIYALMAVNVLWSL